MVIPLCKVQEVYTSMMRKLPAWPTTSISRVRRYSAVDSARDMLFSMVEEEVMNRALEGIRCNDYVDNSAG